MGWNLDARRLVGSASGLVLALALVGCPIEDPGLGLAVGAENRTSEPLTFQVFGDGEWLDLGVTLPPGRSGAILSRDDLREPSRLTVDGCTSGDVVAYAPDGREVARHPPPLCDGDIWIIQPAPGESD